MNRNRSLVDGTQEHPDAQGRPAVGAREERVLQASDNRLAIVSPTSSTEYGIRTLMHDPMYGTGVANKNTGYDEEGFASFCPRGEVQLPKMRTDITVPGSGDTTAATITVKPESKGRNGVYSSVSFELADVGRIERTLNGVAKNLTDNAHSDVNGSRRAHSAARSATTSSRCSTWRATSRRSP
jgi:hypothetical protein